MGAKALCLLGQRYGRLVVVSAAPKMDDKTAWTCLCDCGNYSAVRTVSLRSKRKATKSCGCLVAEKVREANRTHGMMKTPEYRTWSSMLSRCRNPKVKDFPRYGGRGIKVCESWLAFEQFYADMGERPRGTQLDRINNDGNYEPSNCRWANSLQQARNRSSTFMVNVRVGLLEELLDLRGVLVRRLRNGWDIETALLEPFRKDLSHKPWNKGTGVKS